VKKSSLQKILKEKMANQLKWMRETRDLTDESVELTDESVEYAILCENGVDQKVYHVVNV
jgi:hypothetical protein